MRDWPWNWQATPAEVEAAYPCDRLVAAPIEPLFRAVDADADPAEVFRWLCQLRIAPYSYDLADNFGRRSPRTISPELRELERGQRFMTIFRLVDFVPDRELTLKLDDPRAGRVFGELALTYSVHPVGAGRSRIVVKLAVPIEPGVVQSVRRYLLAWGDLLMMQKQLRTLAGLASRTPA